LLIYEKVRVRQIYLVWKIDYCSQSKLALYYL